MRRLSIALTILCFLQSSAYAAATCSLGLLASLDVTWTAPGSKQSFPLVSAAIDEQPAKLVFDSGNFLSMIKEDVAKQLKLPIKNFPPNTVGYGAIYLEHYVIVPRLVVGNMKMGNVVMGLIPDGHHFIDDDSVTGVLATSNMTPLDVELDLGHDKINLFSSDRCRTAPVYWADTYAVAKMHRGHLNDPYFDMELDGKKLQTKVSTTVAESRIISTVSKKLYGFDETSPDLDPSRHYRAMALTTSGLRVTSTEIHVDKAGSCITESSLTTDWDGAVGFGSCYGIYPLTLGLSVLKKLRVYIASKENKMYLTLWDAHPSTTATQN